MPFVTRQRWQNKRWTTGVGPRGSRHVLWGVPAAVAMHEELEIQREGDPDGDDQALVGVGKVGRHYNLKGGDRLIWRAVDKADQEHPLAPFETVPGELDHLAEGGARLSCLRLSRVPDEPVWRHRLTLPADCVLAYQPALTADEIATGAVRPAAVVGSWAVYDCQGCKIAHVLRPCAWAADRSRRIWGEITIAGGISTVRFDRQELASLGVGAILYGLDSFGHTSIGATSWSFGGNRQQHVGKYSPSGDGSATEIYWGNWQYGASDEATCGLGYCSGTTVTSLGRDSAGVSIPAGSGPSSSRWLNFPLDSSLTIYSSDEFALIISSSAGIGVYYDSTSIYYRDLGGITYVSGTLGHLPQPLYSSSTKISAYVVYTPAEGGMSPADAMHGHSADSPAIGQQHQLGPADASVQAHAAGSPTLYVSALVSGPYHVAAKQPYRPGSRDGQDVSVGSVVGQSSIPGSCKGQAYV